MAKRPRATCRLLTPRGLARRLVTLANTPSHSCTDYQDGTQFSKRGGITRLRLSQASEGPSGSCPPTSPRIPYLLPHGMLYVRHWRQAFTPPLLSPDPCPTPRSLHNTIPTTTTVQLVEKNIRKRAPPRKQRERMGYKTLAGACRSVRLPTICCPKPKNATHSMLQESVPRAHS
jgi:hypothetical protein